MKLLSDSRGSLTVEAAVVFPVFLAFMIGIINFTNVTMVYIAMDHAVSETTKLVATHSYPLKILKKGNIPGAAMSGRVSGDTTIGSEIISEIITQVLEKGTEAALETVIREAAQKKIKELYPLGGLEDSDFTITGISVYNPNQDAPGGAGLKNMTLNNEDVAITVEYKVSLMIPFFSTRLCLSSSAVERAWADG